MNANQKHLPRLVQLAALFALSVAFLVSGGPATAAGSITVDAMSDSQLEPGDTLTVDYRYTGNNDAQVTDGAANVQGVVVKTADGTVEMPDGLKASVSETGPGAYQLKVKMPASYPSGAITIVLTIFTAQGEGSDAHSDMPLLFSVANGTMPPLSPIIAAFNNTSGIAIFTNGTCAPQSFQSELRLTVDPLAWRLDQLQPSTTDFNTGPLMPQDDGSATFTINNPNGGESYQGTIRLDGSFFNVFTIYKDCRWDVAWQPTVLPNVPTAWIPSGWSPLTLPPGVEGLASEIFLWAPLPVTFWSPEESFLWGFFNPATRQGTDFPTDGRTIYTNNTGNEVTVPLVSVPPATPAPPPDPASVPVISTRGHFTDPVFADPALTSGHTTTDYAFDLNTLSCSEELVIYVHGFQNSPKDAQENFDTARAALRANGYTQPVVGFSWDSNVGALDFDDAKVIATKNGKKLAQFIMDAKAKWPQMKIRLIAHSLGTRVILNTLKELDGNQAWRDSGSQVRSVHVVGAAVDNEEVDRAEFGTNIQNQVGEFHNFFNSEDDVLSNTFFIEEGDQALGESGAEFSTGGKPSNYSERDVSSEISRDTDGNGTNDESNLGDNHSGYNGVVNSNGILTSDGAMDLVVADWTQQESGP